MSDAPAAVRFEAHRGELFLGETVVEARAAGPRGALRIGGAEGPILRAVSFGERTRAAARATTASAPRDALCAGLLFEATVVEGRADRLVLETVALWLAGAAEVGPSFGDAVLAVARGSGWDPAQIAEAEATDVDRLAATLGAAPAQPRWLRVLFGAGAADELQALRDEMADTLLARAVVENSALATAGDDAGRWPAPETPGEHADTGARQFGASIDAPPLVATPEPTPGGDGWRVSAQAAAVSPPTTTATSSGTPRPRRYARAATALPRRASAERTIPPADALPPAAPATSAHVSLTALSAAAVREAALAVPALASASAHAGLFAGDAASSAPAHRERTPSAVESPAPLEGDADLAAGLAALLDDEADLRGLTR